MDYKLSHTITGRRGAGVLKLRPDGPRRERTVIVLHGLGSSKENALAYLYYLAGAGFDAIAIDLYLHGDRPEACELPDRLGIDIPGVVRDVIYESAADLPAICAEIDVDISATGIVGISAGGFVAHAMAIRRPQFKAMVAAISSPDWLTIDHQLSPSTDSPEASELAEISPVNHPDLYAPIPVCLLNAVVDEVVSAEGTEKLANRLAPIYRAQGIETRLKVKLYPEPGHMYTPEMLVETIGWMDMYL